MVVGVDVKEDLKGGVYLKTQYLPTSENDFQVGRSNCLYNQRARKRERETKASVCETEKEGT